MSSYYTVTLEFYDPSIAGEVIGFLEDHEKYSTPKQPDDRHVVAQSDVHFPSQPKLVESLLTQFDGVSRVGFMQSSDTTDTAGGQVFSMRDSEVVESRWYADRFSEAGDSNHLRERFGRGAIRKIRAHLDFEIYAWWDYTVNGMEKRYEKYLEEDVHQEMVEAGLTDGDEDPEELG